MAGLSGRPLAWREINAQLDYFEEQAGLDTAERFLANLLSSFHSIAEMPMQGASCGFQHNALRNLRRWPVTSFEKWLIFYQVVRPDGEIVHVIHAARDMTALLEG